MNKSILITGAAKNLGAYLAEHLALKGYSIVLHYNQSEKEAKMLADKLSKKKCHVQIIQGDFSKKESLEDFVYRYKKTNPSTYALIHNVGSYALGSFLEATENTWDELIQTNLSSSFFLTRALHPMIQKEKGHFIFLGICGLNGVQADTYCSIYSLTKLGMLFMVKTLAKELASKDVLVNMISPGYLEGSIDQPKKTLPMQRLGSYKDIFETIFFLLGQTYITGQNIEVAGGVRL